MHMCIHKDTKTCSGMMHFMIFHPTYHQRIYCTSQRQTNTPLNPSTHQQTHRPHRQTHSCTDRHLHLTHLQVPVYHPHLMAVEHSLQDLLDAMTACKQQGEQVSLNTFSTPSIHAAAATCHTHTRKRTHSRTHTNIIFVYSENIQQSDLRPNSDHTSFIIPEL